MVSLRFFLFLINDLCVLGRKLLKIHLQVVLKRILSIDRIIFLIKHPGRSVHLLSCSIYLGDDCQHTFCSPVTSPSLLTPQLTYPIFAAAVIAVYLTRRGCYGIIEWNQLIGLAVKLLSKIKLYNLIIPCFCLSFVLLFSDPFSQTKPSFSWCAFIIL